MASTSQAQNMKYEQTLMYGKYKEDLAATAKREAERLKNLREQQQQQVGDFQLRTRSFIIGLFRPSVR